MEIITIQCTDTPDMPNLEAIDSERLLKDILQQLGDNKYRLIDKQPGTLGPIEGYKTPIAYSEVVVHIGLRQNYDQTGPNLNAGLRDYIIDNKLKITQAVRHTDEKHTRIVANVE
jgi:hypothetical protein